MLRLELVEILLKIMNKNHPSAVEGAQRGPREYLAAIMHVLKPPHKNDGQRSSLSYTNVPIVGQPKEFLLLMGASQSPLASLPLQIHLLVR